MTEVNIDELQQARYMSLSSPPAFPEAERLLYNIIDIITITEQRKKARQPIRLAAFKSAVEMIVGDLLVELQTRDRGLSYLSMSTAAFSDRPIGNRMFKRIFFALDKTS
jgi:hypothetical protein